MPLQPEQHRGGVLHVDVEVGLRRSERRGEVAKAPVVEVERRVALAALQVEQRTVPPQMMQEVVAAAPVPLKLVEPRDALAVATLHFHDVGDRVGSPDVRGIDFDCGAHCDDASLDWTEEGYYYGISLKAGDKKTLIRVANSAIADLRQRR